MEILIKKIFEEGGINSESDNDVALSRIDELMHMGDQLSEAQMKELTCLVDMVKEFEDKTYQF